jgi:hypothetical protein
MTSWFSAGAGAERNRCIRHDDYTVCAVSPRDALSLFYLRIPTFCAASLRRCESIPARFFDMIYGCRILQGA